MLTWAAHLRPMYCERIPSGNRMSAPAKTGTEVMNPFCAGLRANSSPMYGARALLSTHTANVKSKYRNAVARVPGWPDFRKSRMRMGIRHQGLVPLPAVLVLEHRH